MGRRWTVVQSPGQQPHIFRPSGTSLQSIFVEEKYFKASEVDDMVVRSGLLDEYHMDKTTVLERC